MQTRSAPLAASDEARPARDPVELIVPSDHPLQHLAFSRQRVAWLDGDELSVRRLGDFELATQFSVPGARNVVGLVGGGFLIAGGEHVYRLSGVEQRPELFARAPRLGPTSILPSTQESEQFWLYYQGITKLPQFDLAAPPVASLLPVIGWLELVDFDRRALLGFGDGSVIYTVPDGLRRIDAEGHRERLPVAELAGRIWHLARARRLDQVWAFTPHHAYRLTAREVAETVERIELAPHSVAVASDGHTLTVLSVEGVVDKALRLRLDVYAQGASPSRPIRFTVSPTLGEAGEPSAVFEPEIALSPSGEWIAVNAFGLHIFDWRRGVLLFPPALGAR